MPRRILTIEELKSFVSYKHSADKTTFENFVVDYPAAWFEKNIVPGFLSANAVSYIGQIPIICFTLYVLLTEGPKMGPENLLSSQNCLLTAAFISWFSWFDIMDGIRARRLHCGSSLGRVIDEAGDITV